MNGKTISKCMPQSDHNCRAFRSTFCLISVVMSHVEERNHENTVYVGDLDQSVDEALLWELFIQVGPVGTF